MFQFYDCNLNPAMRRCIFLLVALASVVICSTNSYEIRIKPPNDVLNHLEGVDATVSCEVYHEGRKVSNAQIYWSNNVGRPNQHTDVYHFSNPKAADGGFYKCNAQVGGVSLSKVIKINFNAKSSFLAYSREQHSVVGMDARIKVSISHPEHATITWKCNDKEIKYDEQYSFDDDQQTLVIKKYTNNNAGIYTVQLWHNALLTDTANINVTTAIIQKPVLPSITCDATQLPTRAVCTLNTAAVDSLRHPTDYTIEYSVIVNNASTENKTAQGKIIDEGILLTGLRPSSIYRVRFMGTNSAGNTTWSAWQNFSTGSARAPEPIEVEKVKYECHSSSCSVDWAAPEDNGAPITHYTLFVSQANATNITGLMPALQNTTLDRPSHTLYELPANSTFVLRLIANNDIGSSAATDVKLINTGGASSAWTFIGIALGLVLLLLALVCCVVFLITRRRNQPEKTLNQRSSNNEQSEAFLAPVQIVTGKSVEQPTKPVVGPSEHV